MAEQRGLKLRQYKGEWEESYRLLEWWGAWHWVNKDRGLRGFGSATWRNEGFGDMDLDDRDDDQEMIELIITAPQFPDHLRKTAVMLFCDYPTDSIRFISSRKSMHPIQLRNRRDDLLKLVEGARGMFYYKIA